MTEGSKREETERFGSYTVYERLGAGGMATVHRASIELENDETREVALKRLLPQFANDKRFVDDFIREAKLAAQLDHPNIVRILELGRIGRTYFIAMDLVRGRPLMSHMRKAYQKRRPAPIAVVIELIAELCDALEHAHEGQIVHRDLTPSNLIITDGGHLKIIDFGVAKALAGGLQTSSGLAKGKLGYMSLEAISGKQLDTRADIFSAGVVLWELIATRRCFKGDNDLQLLSQVRDGVVRAPSQHNPDCPAELDAIVLKAVAKLPADRYQSAAEMRDALEQVRERYGELCSAHEVARWVRSLRAESNVPRPESDAESTVVRLSTSDMFEELDPIGESAEGSQRGASLAEGSDIGTYDDLDPPPAYDDLDESAPTVDEPRPKFKDADTVISVTSFYDRKP